VISRARIADTTLGAAPALTLLDQAVALRVPAAITEPERSHFLAGVFRGKPEWTSNFDGLQFTLGRAWYTHLEQDLADQYFERAAASDQIVERNCPGLQRHMLYLAGKMLGAKVRPRPNYCGAGVHVFPANGYCAATGGDVHFDTEGLTRSQLRARKRAVSLILMLQPPLKGGGLRVWDVRWEGSDETTPTMLAQPHVTVQYGARDLVVIDSYSLHQIQPFEGELDRVSATCHAMESSPGLWDVWF
jgi:hypothetical protein